MSWPELIVNFCPGATKIQLTVVKRFMFFRHSESSCSRSKMIFKYQSLNEKILKVDFDLSGIQMSRIFHEPEAISRALVWEKKMIDSLKTDQKYFKEQIRRSIKKGETNG